MKFIRRFNESQIIKATDYTIHEIVRDEYVRLGKEADLNHIDVSEVTNMKYLFELKYFNGDISQWHVGNVRDMKGTFYQCSFNGNISRWNTENVENMESMFRYSQFNGDISLWNVENVNNMVEMFVRSDFNGDLNKWKPNSLKSYTWIFMFSPLENSGPIWYYCLLWRLFKSGEDYCDSLKYDWFREGTIFIGRLELALELFDGNLSKIDRIKKLSHFNIQN